MPQNVKKITNPKQFEKLVQIMEENPEIARGFNGFSKTKTEYGNAWKDFASVLNTYGPPLRDGEKWLKVWNDLKIKVKKKLIFNKKQMQNTDSGPNKIIHLTKLELSVDKLLNIQAKVNSSDDVFCPKNTNSETTLFQEENAMPATPTPTTAPRTASAPTIAETPTNLIWLRSTPRTYKKKSDEIMELLRKQTTHMRRMEETAKKILELKKKKFKIYEKYSHTKTELLKQKTESEIRLIELQAKQIVLRLGEN